MPALIRSRRIRVFIGADQQDWSTSVGEFLPQWDSLSESGLITISATLEILKVSTNPESIDPRDNPTRWRPGQPVRVEVANSAGAYVTHPMGRLFLLEEPEFPAPGEGIVLELGCRLAWHNTFEYDDEKTGVTTGTALNSATVATNLLVANEMPSGQISLGTWPYSLTVPEGKGAGGSFVQQAGEIAYSNDYRFLYQNTAGTVVAGQLSLAIASPTATITLGTNDVAYQAVKTEGSPPDQIKVAGTGTVSAPIAKPIVSVEEVTGSKEGYLDCTGTGLVSRSTTITSWKDDTEFYIGSSNLGFVSYSGDLIVFSTTTYLEGLQAAVEPYARSPSCFLSHWKRSIYYKVFDRNKGSKLILEAWQEFQSVESFIPQFGYKSRFGFSPTKLATMVYSYGADDVVTQTNYWERCPARILRSNLEESEIDLDQGVTAHDDTTTWKKTGDNSWQKTVSKKESGVLSKSDPSITPSSIIATTSTTSTGTGENQPPRAELWDGGTSTEDVEYQATINYTQPGGGSGRTRKRLYTLPYGFSQAQCETMAQLHLKLIAGRHRAAIVELPVTDALLTAPPLFPFNVVEPSGRVLHYRADSVTWEHTVDTCKVAVSGILVGTTPAPTVGNPTPDPEPITGTIVVADSVPVEASGVQVFATV